MRSNWKNVALLVMGTLLIPTLAAATNVEDQLLQMQERMAQMEDRLQATTDQLAVANERVQQQSVVLESAGLAEERAAGNSLSNFLAQTEISSWLAVSYNYNFTGHDDSILANATTAENGNWPHHPNHNTFQVDQLWIGIDKAPTDESRAGYHVDLVAGWANDVAGYTPNIYTAYVSYMMPILEGLTVDAGVLPTMMGGEVTQTNGNYFVTRGNVWGLQPTTNLGAVAHLGLAKGLRLSVGALNSPIQNDKPGAGSGGSGFDATGGKAVTSQVAYEADMFGLAVGFNWGRDAGKAETGILDVVASVSPMDNLEAWINYDYVFVDPPAGGKTKTNGIAVATRLEVIEDKTGVAIRYEYVDINNPGATPDREVHEITGTIDHALTENLTAKAEVRWDNSDPGVFQTSSAGATNEDQVGVLVQLLYEF